MLRAGTIGANPLIIAGLCEENVARLKNGQPIIAELSTFSPGTAGRLIIFYGKTHAEMETTIQGLVSDKTHKTVDPRVDQEEQARREHAHILICTVGLPRSGKTTWAKSQAYPMVNPDSIRLAIHGQRFIDKAEPFVWATAKAMVRALFIAGHKTVIVDATNNTKKRRADWFDDSWATFFKVIDTPAATCIERAKAVGDNEIIPVIERMQATVEPLDETCKRW